MPACRTSRTASRAALLRVSPTPCDVSIAFKSDSNVASRCRWAANAVAKSDAARRSNAESRASSERASLSLRSDSCAPIPSGPSHVRTSWSVCVSAAHSDSTVRCCSIVVSVTDSRLPDGCCGSDSVACEADVWMWIRRRTCAAISAILSRRRIC